MSFKYKNSNGVMNKIFTNQFSIFTVQENYEIANAGEFEINL